MADNKLNSFDYPLKPTSFSSRYRRRSCELQGATAWSRDRLEQLQPGPREEGGEAGRPGSADEEKAQQEAQGASSVLAQGQPLLVDFSLQLHQHSLERLQLDGDRSEAPAKEQEPLLPQGPDRLGLLRANHQMVQVDHHSRQQEDVLRLAAAPTHQDESSSADSTSISDLSSRLRSDLHNFAARDWNSVPNGSVADLRATHATKI